MPSSSTYETTIGGCTFLESDPRSYSTRRVGVQECRIVVTGNCRSASESENVGRLTGTADLGLFTNDHTLQNPGVFVGSKLFRDFPDLAIVKSMLLEYRVKNSESVTNLVDRFCGRHQ